MKRIFFVMLAVVLMPFSNAGAHDWWLNKSGDRYDIVMAHIEGDGVAADPYEAQRAVQAAGYRANGDGVPITIDWKADRTGAYILPPEAFSALTALVYNKYWMKTTTGWENDEIKGLEGVIKEGQSFKLTKHIEKWHDWLAKPLGQRLEIVPMKDPTVLEAGDTLPVRLYFMGRQIREARITEMSRTHTLKDVKTDDCFNITIGKGALQFINTKIEIPVKDREIIWYAASLTFFTSK